MSQNGKNWRHAQPAAVLASPIEARITGAGRFRGPRNIWALVIAALHRSRRHQARRILRQHRHLIAAPKQASPPDLNQPSGDDDNAGE